jgi:hypothetical protein
MYQELAVEQIALLTLGAEMLFLLFAAPYYLVSLIRELIGAANEAFHLLDAPSTAKVEIGVSIAVCVACWTRFEMLIREFRKRKARYGLNE